MPIDSKTVGSNERQVNILGDPTTAAQYASVTSIADAQNLAGLYALLSNQIGLLYNGSTYDRIRSAKGTTGILAVNTEGTKATYSAAISGFTPAATATDFFMIIGSGTKTVRVTRIELSGVASLPSNVTVLLIKRISANSGGTAATVTPAQHDSNDSAPTAVVSSYSANPTTGSSGGLVRAATLDLGDTSNTALSEVVAWDFSTRNSEGLVLRGVGQAYVLNFNGAAVPGGMSITIDVEWTEE